MYWENVGSRCLGLYLDSISMFKCRFDNHTFIYRLLCKDILKSPLEYKACVKSVLLYGSETWLMSNTMTQKLQVFINKCLRIICETVELNKLGSHSEANNTKEMEVDRHTLSRNTGVLKIVRLI